MYIYINMYYIYIYTYKCIFAIILLSFAVVAAWAGPSSQDRNHQGPGPESMGPMSPPGYSAQEGTTAKAHSYREYSY